MVHKEIQFMSPIVSWETRVSKGRGHAWAQCKLLTGSFASLSMIDRNSITKALEEANTPEFITTKDFDDLLTFVVEVHLPLKWVFTFREGYGDRQMIYPSITLDRKYYLRQAPDDA